MQNIPCHFEIKFLLNRTTPQSGNSKLLDDDWIIHILSSVHQLLKVTVTVNAI